MTLYQSASGQTKGARPYQEDMAVTWRDPEGVEAFSAARNLLAVLADGMGGHAGGALASRTVCEAFLGAFTSSATCPVAERLRQALEASDQAIAREVASQPRLHGMGSTLLAVNFGAEGLQWISVGDSPLYLYRRGEIASLNEDHSLAPALDQLAAEGRITAEQARNDPRRHMLRSAITGDKPDLVDQSRQPLPLAEGDFVILASDGIHALEPHEIARLAGAYGAEGCEALATALIRSVEDMRLPHQDNTTVVVVRAIADPH
jgi:serine/threonine protein phosphatase PrpC